jgi:hypothetical protein
MRLSVLSLLLAISFCEHHAFAATVVLFDVDGKTVLASNGKTTNAMYVGPYWLPDDFKAAYYADLNPTEFPLTLHVDTNIASHATRGDKPVYYTCDFTSDFLKRYGLSLIEAARIVSNGTNVKLVCQVNRGATSGTIKFLWADIGRGVIN